MGTLRQLVTVPDLAQPSWSQRVFWTLTLLSLIPLVIVLPMTPPHIGVPIVAGWIALLWVVITFARNKVENIALFWLACYPLCYYFLSFPHNQTLFTVDRAVVGLLTLYMLLARDCARQNPLLPDVKRSAWLWGLYVIVCLGCLAGRPMSSPLYSSLQIALDGLTLPALLGLYAMQYLPVQKNLALLHRCSCILAIGIGAIVIGELSTGQNLLPWLGATRYVLGGAGDIRRVDGPFEMPALLSIISILVFFLIVYLRHLMADRIGTGQIVLHGIGAPMALFAAFAPLNRGLLLVLAPVAVIDMVSRTSLLKRRSWILIFSVVLLCSAFARVFYPDVFEDRTLDPSNAYQRIAQDRETLRVVSEHPFLGVGLGMYHNLTAQDARYLVRWMGIESMNWPHNAIMSVLAEGGIVGLTLYLLSQSFLVRAMWKIRRQYPAGWLAFLYCFISYTLYGLDFAVNYYSDVTLLYMFIIGLICNSQTQRICSINTQP